LAGTQFAKLIPVVNAICKMNHDLAGLFCPLPANWGMRKTKTLSPRRLRAEPLESGQVWEVAGMNLQVSLVGKLLVHYKLAKPGAVRIPNLVNGRATIEKYLKKNKAVLVKREPVATSK
jgi:hypothetical protein